MSKRAITVILLALALMLIAGTIRSGWLYLVSSILISLVVAGLFSGWIARRRVEVERDCPGEVFEGQDFPVRLRVHNSGRSARHLVTVRDDQFSGPRPGGVLGEMLHRGTGVKDSADRGIHPGGKRSGGGPRSRTVTIERIPPGGRVELSYRMSAGRRGIYERADLVVSCGGVFGVAEIKHKIKVDSPITVFPKIYMLDWFPVKPRETIMPVEFMELSRKGIGQDYYGVREYVHGDSLRHIHWKSSARQGKLIVKEYQQEFRPSLGILVLLREPAYGGPEVNSLEDALRATASLVGYYAESGSLPTMVIPSGEKLDFLQPGSLRDCLRLLAGYQPPREPGTFKEALASSRYGLYRDCALLAVTNYDPGEITAALRGDLGMGDLSVVLALEESYAGRFSEGRLSGSLRELAGAAEGSRVDIYLVTGERGIDECLKRPLSTIGG